MNILFFDAVFKVDFSEWTISHEATEDTKVENWNGG
jgi:hypothetical protein